MTFEQERDELRKKYGTLQTTEQQLDLARAMKDLYLKHNKEDDMGVADQIKFLEQKLAQSGASKKVETKPTVESRDSYARPQSTVCATGSSMDCYRR